MGADPRRQTIMTRVGRIRKSDLSSVRWSVASVGEIFRHGGRCRSGLGGSSIEVRWVQRDHPPGRAVRRSEDVGRNENGTAICE